MFKLICFAVFGALVAVSMARRTPFNNKPIFGGNNSHTEQNNTFSNFTSDIFSNFSSNIFSNFSNFTDNFVLPDFGNSSNIFSNFNGSNFLPDLNGNNSFANIISNQTFFSNFLHHFNKRGANYTKPISTSNYTVEVANNTRNHF